MTKRTLDSGQVGILLELLQILLKNLENDPEMQLVVTKTFINWFNQFEDLSSINNELIKDLKETLNRLEKTFSNINNIQRNNVQDLEYD